MDLCLKRLHNLVVRAINDHFDKGKCPSNKRKVLLYEYLKGTNPGNIFIKTNWRPISLLNVVYKVKTSCTVERMKQVLLKLMGKTCQGLWQTDT